MKFLVTTLILSFFVANSLAETIPAQNKLHLWEVKKGESIDYILGSIHFCIEVSDLSPLVKALHDSTNTHAYEMIPKPPDSMFDFSSAADLRILQEMYRTSEGFENRSYENNNPVPVEYYSKLARIGVPSFFHRFMVNDALAPVIGVECMFKRPYKSIDHELMVNSIVASKKVIELENEDVRETAETLSGGPLLVSELLEYYSDDEIKRIQLSILDLAKNYLSGIITPEDLTDSDGPDMIFRNKYWMTQLPTIFSENSAFVTVGMGHLYGENGILKMLENEGFELKRILQ